MKNASTGTVARFLLRIFLRCRASFAVAIIALDDISCMDELSWKLIELIFDNSPHTIILGTSRPVIGSDFWSRLNKREYEGRFLHMRLLAMQQSDVERLIANKLGIKLSQVDSDIATEIFVRSGGRPRLVTEIFEKTIEVTKKPMMLKLKVCRRHFEETSSQLAFAHTPWNFNV
jgi:predicted ATPase